MAENDKPLPPELLAIFEMSERERWSAEWMAERRKPSRQQNLTPEERRQRLEFIRMVRNPGPNIAYYATQIVPMGQFRGVKGEEPDPSESE